MADGQLKTKLANLFKGEHSEAVETLTPKLQRMPSERLLFIMGIGAGLTGLSLKTALEFFRVAPEVGRLLNTFELKTWGEAGKRLAATNIEAAHEYFTASPETLAALPQSYRLRTLTLCTKQASLSTRVAVDSFKLIPHVVQAMGDTSVLQRIFTIASEVARHSVKHSFDLLRQAPKVAAHLHQFDPDDELVERILELTASFVHRSGGTAAEFFLAIPESMTAETASYMGRLLNHTGLFLDRSGGLALQYFRAAGSVLALAGPEAYEQWTRFSFVISTQGNATSYQFLQMSTPVVSQLARHQNPKQTGKTVQKVMDVVAEIGRYNVTSAIACFKASPQALQRASLDQFRIWALRGLELYPKDSRSAQAYYGLESRTSREALTGRDGGVSLEQVSQILRLYVEGLTGKSLTVSPLTGIPEQARISDGKTIYLPSLIADFPDEDTNFRLYKVLAAHSAGQLEFGTYVEDTPDLLAIQRELFDRYRNAPRKRANVNYSVVLKHFPQAELALRLFTTLENGRIDRQLRRAYRGIRRDLDFVGERLRAERPQLEKLPTDALWHEILFELALCGGTTAEVRRDYATIVVPLEEILLQYLDQPGATVGDTLQAVRQVYGLIEERSQSQEPQAESANQDQNGEGQTTGAENSPTETQPQSTSYKNQGQTPNSAFDFWASDRQESPPPLEDVMASLSQDREANEQKLDPNDKAFFYDEWDRELNDYRLNWCRVIERRNPEGSRVFVEVARSRHGGMLSSIRRQFQMMKPESLRKIPRELDGEDFDFDALVDNVINRRTTGSVDERVYVRRLRRQRDVAVSFLLDMSSSTARTIGRFPNMPYTRPGQRIIDIEKEGLVLMSEALEAVGDVYSIYGFTSEGRRNVMFYVIKDFNETYSEVTEKRIGGVTYQNNTRLGAALRHASARLSQQDARTKLLILLSDGRPYDHDYGDARYAREDVRVALRQAQVIGVTSFCITIDRESEKELQDLYGEVGYTIIDDVLSLPERLPGIYRRLTT
ncbi:MAG: VWA domain-containing protein [Blastocatellia bacterium]|nr:VWA domain-containing protein [Blastocatellia bacterium]